MSLQRIYALTFALGAALTVVAGGLVLMSFQQTGSGGGIRLVLAGVFWLWLVWVPFLADRLQVIIGIVETMTISF